MGVRRESRHLLPVAAGAETPVVVQDAKVLVAGCKGVANVPLLDGSRESRHLPPVAAGAETPVVVQDAKVLVAGCKGVANAPCSMGPGRAEVSLVAMQRR
jgi:hypothetical protein